MLSAAQRPLRFVRAEPDERLVALVRDGDRDAFEELYDRHAAGLLSFCRHMLGSQEEAEDAVQHTFLAAHKSLLADEREIHLKAWLYAIARNRCLSLLRGKRERVAYDEELDDLPSVAGLSAEVEQREDLRALLGDLAQLPDDQRSALLLSELGAHTHDDVAEVLGVRRDKVKALVFQAREGLAAARTARETPCLEIREQLATARGGTLRRGNLRRHVDACAGCRAFRDEVHRQRVAFGIIIPVAPSFALKQAILGAAAAATATAGGAAAGGGGATIAGAGAKAAAVKLMTVVAVAGGTGSAGYVAVHEVGHGKVAPPAVAREGTPRTPTTGSSEPIAQETPLPAATTAEPVRHRAAKPRKAKAKPRAAHPRTHFAADRPGRTHHMTRVSLERESSGAPPKEHRRPPVKAVPPRQPAVMPAGDDDDDDHHELKIKGEKSFKEKKARKDERPVPPGQAKKDQGLTPPGQEKPKKHDGDHEHGDDEHGAADDNGDSKPRLILPPPPPPD